MTAVQLTQRNSGEFLERFLWFADGVITGIQLHLPRDTVAGRKAAFDIQAMDATRNNEWRLVRLTVSGVYEYQFLCSRQYSYFILSDGLNLECTSERCVLDLDPGPNDWSANQVQQHGEYSKQYVIGSSCEYEITDGPFI
jgi:hypothetical protein